MPSSPGRRTCRQDTPRAVHTHQCSKTELQQIARSSSLIFSSSRRKRLRYSHAKIGFKNRLANPHHKLHKHTPNPKL